MEDLYLLSLFQIYVGTANGSLLSIEPSTVVRCMVCSIPDILCCY